MSKEPKIKDVKMLTSDGVEVKVGMNLYVGEFKDKYKKPPQAYVRIHQVLYVNQTTRRIKIRTEEGKESDFTLMDGKMIHFRGREKKAIHDVKIELAAKIAELRKEKADLETNISSASAVYNSLGK